MKAKAIGAMVAVVLAILIVFPVGRAWAGISVGGDAGQVSPADPSAWTTSTTGYIGLTSGKTGTLTVDGGSNLLSGVGYLGNSGSTGTATVTGPGSTWTNSGNLSIYNNSALRVENGGKVSSGSGSISGSSTATVTGAGSIWINSGKLNVGGLGTATLRVENGGKVSSGSGSISDTGSATVTGPGSTWTTTGSLTVSSFWVNSAALELTVEDGGTVNTGTLYAAMGDLKGNGAINAKGLVSDIDLVFDATHGANQALSFGTGGTLNLSLNGQSYLGAGYRGTGSITVADGVKITTGVGYLGYNTASFPVATVTATGSATVTGPGSTWTNSTLNVGHGGTGTLTVENGGTVSSGDARIGWYPGSTGTATVTGPGSTWTIGSELMVGTHGTGTLTVENGGTVNTQTLYAATGDLKGNGTINVNGLVSDIDLVFDATHGANQALSFGTGGTLNLSLNGQSYLGAGYRGTGSITVADGVKIATSYGYLGYNSGSTGNATVTGPGSTWTSGHLYVGNGGAGSLMIADGGKVSSTSGSISYNSMVTVTGPGSTWTNGNNLDVNSGLAALTIADGGKVSNSSGSLRSNSTATVTGPGSIWTNSGDLSVGNGGAGCTLMVEDGGLVSSAAGYIGRNSGFTSTVTVTGQGSTWINSGNLSVGDSGAGTLTIADGGKVKAKSVSINSQSTVNLRVSGSGMLVLGDASNTGSISNSGKVNLYADAFLAAGTYSPITEYASGAMSWSEAGTYDAIGGTWDSTAKTLTVVEATALTGGTSYTLSSGERLLVTDPGSGRRVGVSIGTVPDGTTFSSMWTDEAVFGDLRLAYGGSVLDSWHFTSNFADVSALLSFDIGLGAWDLEPQRYDGTSWVKYGANDLIYNVNGIASFTAGDFGNGGGGGGAVPEPASFVCGIIGLGMVGGYLKKRRAA